MAKLKYCPFRVNTTTELKTIKTTNNNKIQLKAILSKQVQNIQMQS
jgi:hypothetical protein